MFMSNMALIGISLWMIFLLEMEDKGRLQEVDLSSSYKAAMEALSSLISRQKRGTEPKKAGKLGLMFKYLQVMIAQTCIN